MAQDETTTEEQVVDSGAEQALPDTQVEQTPADSSDTEVSEQATNETEQGAEEALPNQEQQTADSEYQKKLNSFAKGQGIDDLGELSDRELSLLKSAYDSKSSHDRTRQKASELEKDLGGKSDQYAEQVAQQTGQDPELLKRLQRIEIKDSVREFYDSNPDARKHEADMIKELQNKPHLAGDLESLYATVVFKKGGLDSVKTQTKQDTLRSLAQKQQAAVPKGNATQSGTPNKKPFSELSIKEMEAQLGFARR